MDKSEIIKERDRLKVITLSSPWHTNFDELAYVFLFKRLMKRHDVAPYFITEKDTQ